MTTIEEIQKRTVIGIKEAEKKVRVAKRKEKLRLEKEKKEQERRFNSNLTWEINNFITAIEKAADAGKSSIVETRCNGNLVDAIKSHFQKMGYTVTVESEYIEAERGDPDSGEGQHDSYVSYEITISWKK
jgi:hypothetical protein